MATNLPKELIDALPKQFESTAQYQGRGYTSYTLNPPTNAVPQYERGGMGMNTLTGYQIPLEMPANYPKTDARGFPVPPLVANYDPQGKLKSISAKERYWADNQVHILPEYSPTGEFLNANPATNEQAGSGGLGGFISDVAKDYGPMILAGLGANLAAGNFGNLFSPSVSLAEAGAATGGATAGAGTAAGSGALSPFASQAAGTYGAGGASAASLTGSAIASQIATQGVTPSLLQSAASFLNVKPETLASLAPSAIQGLLSAGGSYLQSEQATEAAQTQANAQIEAARIAADSARFRPVGVTTRFGSSNFQTDAAGNVISAGYTASPEILDYQNRLSRLAGQGMTDIEGARTAYAPLTGAAQNLFSLGGSYLKKTPEEVAADYISKQQALLAPSQENQLAMLQNKLFQQGRTGAATAQGGNLMATSPELAAYYNSLAQSNLVLAAQADQEAQNRIKFGAGLFDTGAGLQGKYYAGQTAAYSPFTTAMDTSSGLESLAQTPLTLGTQIGAKTTASAAEAGRLTGTGIINAASTMAPANAYSLEGNVLAGAANSPNVTGALNRAFGVTAQPAQQQYTFNPVTGQYVPVQQSVFAT
jgi:hypothetical protein